MAQRFRFPLTLAIWAILAGSGALLSIFYIGFRDSIRLESEAFQQLSRQDSLLHLTYRLMWESSPESSTENGTPGPPSADPAGSLAGRLRHVDSACAAFEQLVDPGSATFAAWRTYRQVLDSLATELRTIAGRPVTGRTASGNTPKASASRFIRLRIIKDDVHQTLISERLSEIAAIDERIEDEYAGWAMSGFGFVVAGVVLGLYARKRERDQLITTLRMAAGEEQFRALVEQTQEAVLIVQQGVVAYANAAAVKLFEFATFDEMRRADIFALAGPAVRAMLLERSSGRSPGEELARGEEVRSLTQQGRLVDLEVSATVVTWDHHVGVLATLRDITSRKMQEREQALLLWEQEALSQIDRRLIGVVDLGRILDSILGHLVNLTKAPWAGVLLRDGTSQRFRWRSMVGANAHIPGDAFLLAPPLQAILGSHEPFVLQEMNTPPTERLSHLAGVAEEHVISSVWIPLKGDPSVRGVLAVGYRQAHDFNRRELRLLVSLAEKMSIAAANASLYEDLLAREKDLEMLSGLRVNAQEEERRRIAREIHDGLGQILTAIKFNVEILEDSATLNEDDHRRIADVKTLLDNVMKEAREISYNLMPSVLDDFGLAPALQLLAERFGAQTGVRVTFVAQGMAERLSATVEIALYRIVQEALTNAVRHGEASLVAIQAFRSGGEVRLTIEDNGRGMDPEQAVERRLIGSGIGLASMRERVNSFRGELAIESSPGNGTLITVRIPIASRTSNT